MLCFPNAKINIGLNIVSKRHDGYHNLETIFCPVSLCDILEFVPEKGLKSGEYHFDTTGIQLEGAAEGNLAVKAYVLLNRDFNLPGVLIHLHKIIPPGAGLGGGSSDAAFMLKYLDREFDLRMDEEKLLGYASELGSDCAFFFKNRPVFAFERGDQFRALPVFPEDLRVILVNPGIHISTVSAFAEVSPRVPDQSLEELILLPLPLWKERIVNDFESAMIRRYPVIGVIKQGLYSAGAQYSSMTGSGSSVYGLFRGKLPAIPAQFSDFFTWSGPLLEQSLLSL